MTTPKDIDVKKYRKPEYPIEDIILDRWSPRAMSGEDIPEDELMILFEAARWAPSSSNEQPWRFVYAKKGTPEWDMFFAVVNEGNQRWSKNASILVIIFSKDRFTKYDADNATASFSAGSAFQNLALQGSSTGLVVHPFGGFNREAAASAAGMPEGYSVEVMIAIGKPGEIERLEEKDRVREFPSGRMSISGFVFEGRFP